MMKTILLILVMTGGGCCWGQQETSSPDVRKVKWWMTKQQVIAIEKRKPSKQSKERVVFEKVKVGDDEANLLYEFHSNKLVSLTYTFTKLGGILYMPYISYAAIDRKITERYGKPLNETEKWYGDKDAYKVVVGYSDAVTKGDLFLSTTWISARTEITHLMNKDVHGLSYSSRLMPKPASEDNKDF